MNTSVKLNFILHFLTWGSCSCSEQNIKLPDDSVYIPLRIGQYSEFEVKRTSYSLSALPEVQQFSTRQIISDSFRDINNQLVHKMDYLARNDQMEWKLDSTSTIWRTMDKTISKENGQIIVNMIYPITDQLLWNGNMFNVGGKVMFKVTDKGKAFKNGLTIFPNTVTIVRQDDSTLLSRNRYIEIYAPEIGLIRKEKIFLQYCNTPDCVGKGIINSGWTEFSMIKNYGK